MINCKFSILDMPATGTGLLAGPLRAELSATVGAGAHAISAGVPSCIDANSSARDPHRPQISRDRCAPPTPLPALAPSADLPPELPATRSPRPPQQRSPTAPRSYICVMNLPAGERAQCPSLSRRREAHVPDTRSETVAVLTLFLLMWICCCHPVGPPR